MEFKPYDYQRYAIKYILTHESCGLFLEMGLGKTVITLTAVKKLLADFEVSRVLVIAPLRVAQTVWEEETEKWDHLNGIRCVKVLGPLKDRLAALKHDADIYIVNRENVPWIVEHYGAKWPFDMVVIDELSSFKSHRSQRFRALKLVRSHIRRLVGLTGTPTPNGLIDLWPQIYLLDSGQRLGRFIGNYRAAFFYPAASNGHVVFRYALKEGAAERIHKRISDICMSMKAEDYVKLPPRLDIRHDAVLSDSEMKAYKTMEKDYVLSLPEDQITAMSAAALCCKLTQLASGTVYDEKHEAHAIHAAKLDVLGEIIEAAQGQPVLVYYGYRSDVDRIRERFPDAVQLSTADDVKNWNAGKIRLLIAHPDSAGHGLNLQAGGHIMVWYTLTWSLEKYQQANARLHRTGQTVPVQVHQIIARDTIDETIIKSLAKKNNTQEAFLSAVKVLRDKLT